MFDQLKVPKCLSLFFFLNIFLWLLKHSSDVIQHLHNSVCAIKVSGSSIATDGHIFFFNK